MRSMALRSWYRSGEKQFFQRRLAFGRMFGAAPPALDLTADDFAVVPLVADQDHGWGMWSSRSAAVYPPPGRRSADRWAQSRGPMELCARLIDEPVPGAAAVLESAL
jgi:hypothetical protein